VRGAVRAIATTALLCVVLTTAARLAAQQPPPPASVEAFDVGADTLDVDASTGQARFAGHVLARRGDWILRCTALVATYDENGQLLEAEAEGPVELAGPDVRAQAASARFQRDGDVIVLTGEPTIERGQHRVVAEVARVYLQEQRVEMEKVRGRFVLDAPAQP
jgi:lipopolysaccharide transport protein LptA